MIYSFEKLLYKPEWYKPPTHAEIKEEEQKEQKERQEVKEEVLPTKK